MNWWGKLIGGAFGFMLGGPLGALLGAALGHQVDRGLAFALAHPEVSARERVQTAFFTATFSVLGYLAKADGRVSEEEIEFAEAVMAHMALDGDQRRLAIDLFRQGRQPEFNLDEVLDQFRRECHRRLTLLQMFLEIQMQGAYADGRMDAREKAALLRIFDHLGFSRADFDHLDALVRTAHHFTGEPGSKVPPTGQLLAEGYAILGVAADATDAEVKRAYRRLLNQHHPDKLVARGLPDEMVKLANEKTHEIKEAYEQIKKARRMR